MNIFPHNQEDYEYIETQLKSVWIYFHTIKKSMNLLLHNVEVY